MIHSLVDLAVTDDHVEGAGLAFVLLANNFDSSDLRTMMIDGSVLSSSDLDAVSVHALCILAVVVYVDVIARIAVVVVMVVVSDPFLPHVVLGNEEVDVECEDDVDRSAQRS